MKSLKLLVLCATLVSLSNFSAFAWDTNVKVYFDLNRNGIRDRDAAGVPVEPLANTVSDALVTIFYCDAAGTTCTNGVADEFDTGVQWLNVPVIGACREFRLEPPPGVALGQCFSTCVKVDQIPAGFSLNGWQAFEPVCPPCQGGVEPTFDGEPTDNDIFGAAQKTRCIVNPFVLPGPTLEIGIIQPPLGIGGRSDGPNLFEGLLEEGPTETPAAENQFVRGDGNSTGDVNITDGIFVLIFLFGGAEEPQCEDAADADDSGTVNLTDGIFILNFLFGGQTAPPPPFEICGPDPTDDAVGCAREPEACAG